MLRDASTARVAMLHLMKLAVGIKDIEELRAWQTERAAVDPPLRHRTLNAPRRRDDVLGGGSMYWVIAGSMLVRQRIVDVIEDTKRDGTPCAALVLDPELVPLEGRPTKAFQGWRYLRADDAPADPEASARVQALVKAATEKLQAIKGPTDRSDPPDWIKGQRPGFDKMQRESTTGLHIERGMK